MKRDNRYCARCHSEKTMCMPHRKFDQPFKALLIGKGCRIVGEFRCPGVVGGPLGISLKNKGHPDEQDLADARAFAKALMDA